MGWTVQFKQILTILSLKSITISAQLFSFYFQDKFTQQTVEWLAKLVGCKSHQPCQLGVLPIVLISDGFIHHNVQLIETNFRDAFKELRDAKDFFDYTLTCGTIQIQAHRLILSACSPIFRSIFRENPHQHPFIYLRGIENADLDMVINFMYYNG